MRLIQSDEDKQAYLWIFCNGELPHKLSYRNHKTSANHRQNRLHLFWEID